MKVGVSLMFSAAESSAYLCSFSLTNSYFEAKEKLLKDEDLSKAYRATLHIAKSNPPIDFKTSPNLFCKKKYELLGPSNLNKKGPNGGPSPVFYK